MGGGGEVQWSGIKIGESTQLSAWHLPTKRFSFGIHGFTSNNI